MSASANSGKVQSSQVEEEEDIIFQQQMGNRTILLHRPKKLNSLNLSMIKKILPRLKVWQLSLRINRRHGKDQIWQRPFYSKGLERKHSVRVVMLQVSHSFAALKLALVTAKAKGTLLQQARENYFRHEYTLDYYLSTFSKPIIAVMDGITSIPALSLSDL